MNNYADRRIDSTVNSTIVPLGAGETFQGGGEINGYPHVGVVCQTDADGTLYFGNYILD